MAARREAEDGRRKQPGSSLALRSTPNKQIQRLQQRKSHSPYPKGSPRTPVRQLAEEARSNRRSQPTSPQSPSMRAISSILGFLSPFASAQVKSSAAFGDPEDSIADDTQQNTLALEDETTQEAGEEREDEDEEMKEPDSIYPSLPNSSLEGGRSSSDSIMDGHSIRAAESPRRSTTQTTSFPAPRQSTPSRNVFDSMPSTSARQIRPPTSPIFTFGRRSDVKNASSPALPAYPRAPAQSKVTSPLAKNYDLLARFFAEKAEQEAKGRAGDSAVSLQSGEAEEEETGLTEIEVAGCLKLIEESLTQGRAKDLERLRGDALERISNAPITPNYIDTSRYTRGRVSRSPSLPLGAAAGELSGTYGMQSRPSSSFLSPAYPRSDDAQINRSLASTFSTSSAPLKRRHRPLYLGPGQGASAASNLIKRNQQLQQQRKNQPNRPLSHSRSFAAPSRQREDIDPEDRDSSDVNVKRRRMDLVSSSQNDEPFHQSLTSNLPSSQSMPSFLFNVSPAKTSTPEQPQKVMTAPIPASPSPLPIRTATADAMLSILSSGPSIPLRSSANTSSSMMHKETETSLAPDIINPYQTRSRIMKRNSAAPNSSSLAAKEKERLKEEREKKQKALAEVKKSKESTLEMIERTAPSQSKKGALRRTRAADVESEEAYKKRKDEDEENERQTREAKKRAAEEKEHEEQKIRAEKEKKEKDEQKKKQSAERERQRKTEEVKKRMEQLSNQSSAASSSTAQSPPSSTSTSEVSAPTLTPSASSTARKSLSFGSTFLPKKPSPLSQADSMAPDSPSSSSEQSEGTKPFSFAGSISNGFAFSTPSVSKPTEAPIPKPTEAPKTTVKDARQEALEVAASLLPKFDFTANVYTKTGSSGVAVNDDASQMAREKALSDLPVFDIMPISSSTSAATMPIKTTNDTAKSVIPFSFASSATSSMASTPLASTTTSDVEGDSAAESVSSEKSVSALLSGTGEGEEDEDCLHEVRSKVWNLKDGKWIDLGIGLFKIKKNKKDGKRRVLIRNEGNGKVMVNFRLMEGFKPIKDKNIVSFLGFDGEGKPTNYRCKVKTNDMAEELLDTLQREAMTQ